MGAVGIAGARSVGWRLRYIRSVVSPVSGPGLCLRALNAGAQTSPALAQPEDRLEEGSMT